MRRPARRTEWSCGARGGLAGRPSPAYASSGSPRIAFCDGNRALWGQEVDGVRVHSVEDAAAAFGKDATFVITIWGPHDQEERWPPAAKGA